MSRVITIRLEIPEGVEFRIGGDPSDDADDEPLPPASWNEISPPEPTFRTIPAAHPGSTTGCPVHRLAWRTVPAGVSKRTGRPYQAFVACPEAGCDERPSAARRTAS